MENTQIDSIVEGPSQIELVDGSSITIRPFTFGSLTLAQKIGLTIFTGEEEVPEDEQNEDSLDLRMLEQLKAFFWMQSKPIPEVLKAVREGTWQDAVEEFGMYLPMHKMHEMMQEVNRISSMTAEAAVDVLPKGDDDPDEPGE